MRGYRGRVFRVRRPAGAASQRVREGARGGVAAPGPSGPTLHGGVAPATVAGPISTTVRRSRQGARPNRDAARRPEERARPPLTETGTTACLMSRRRRSNGPAAR